MTNRVRSCRCCSVKCDEGSEVKRESRGSKQSQRRHETENFIKSGQQQLLPGGRSRGGGAAVGGKQQVLACSGKGGGRRVHGELVSWFWFLGRF